MPASKSIEEVPRQPPAKFTNLALLLRLLAFLNSEDSSKNGNPSLSPTLNSTLRPRAHSIENKGLSPLEAAAAILVQQHEIIATTYSGKSVLVSHSKSDPDPNQSASSGTDLDVPATDPLPTTVTDSGEKLEIRAMKFAAVPNPDEMMNAEMGGKKDGLKLNPHNLRVLRKGSNLLDKIKKYEWAFALTYVSIRCLYH
jgi:hypothetical protein